MIQSDLSYIKVIMTSQHDESDAAHQRSNSDYYTKGSQEEATESALTLAKIQHVSSLPPFVIRCIVWYAWKIVSLTC